MYRDYYHYIIGCSFSQVSILEWWL